MLNKIFYTLTIIALLVYLYVIISLLEESGMDIAFLILSGFLVVYGLLLTLYFIKNQKKQQASNSTKIFYNVLLGLVTIVALKLNHHYLTDADWSLGPLISFYLLHSLVGLVYFGNLIRQYVHSRSNVRNAGLSK